MLAHAVAGGDLPVPVWLLAYGGAALVLLTAVALRASWPTPRLVRFRTDSEPQPARPGPMVGGLVGILLLTAVTVAAIVGRDSVAANVAPVAVLVVWWVGLPIACLAVGDVMRLLNPFTTAVGLVERARGRVPSGRQPPPVWMPAAFLAAFSWYFLAYHRPGSPRALAWLLVAYTAAALLAGLRWGSGWLATGEGFGNLSAGVARLSWRSPRGPVPPGLTPVLVVWLGGTVFDAFASTTFWFDVLGTSRGWARTGLNTVGLIWMTAIVAGVTLLVVRVAERGAERGAPDGRERAAAPPRLGLPLGVALLPAATGWFLAHDLTLLLFEGQNFLALVSDPLGRGWDLFGTYNRTIDYGIVEATWVRWAQVVALAAGHVATVVVLHDLALSRLARRSAVLATGAMAAAAATSMVLAVLLLLAP